MEAEAEMEQPGYWSTSFRSSATSVDSEHVSLTKAPEQVFVEIKIGGGSVAASTIFEDSTTTTTSTAKNMSAITAVRKRIGAVLPDMEQGGGECSKSASCKETLPIHFVQGDIHIREGEAPAQHLLLFLVDLKETLANVTNRMMTGFAASKEEWEVIRETTWELGNVFRNRVVFDWEGSDEPSSTSIII